MRLEPYIRVDDTPFSATRDDIVRSRGQPLRSGRNDVGLDELDYDDEVFRFQDGGRLEEVTKDAPVLLMGTIAVPFATLAAFVREHDPQMFEKAGFVVSPRYGLAFDPACPAWVTALAAHCIDTWREI